MARDHARALNPAQLAFMREWFASCIDRVEALPPSPQRDASLRTLRQSLDRYSEGPPLRLVWSDGEAR